MGPVGPQSLVSGPVSSRVSRALRPVARQAVAVARLTGRSAWRGLEGFYHSDNLTYAASIAYYALLSLFPFFLLAFALLGRATADVERRNAVLNFVLRYFPSEFEFITRQLDAFRNSQFTLSVVGTVALVWGALGVFGAISTAVNYAWGVSEQRSFWKHKLLSFVMLLVAGLILLYGVEFTAAYARLRRGRPEEMPAAPTPRL